MAPVDTFFRSVRDAFRPGDDTPAWIWIATGACAAAVIVAALIARYQRRQAAENAFARFLAGRKVSPAQAALIARLSHRADTTPQLFATHIDVFERATALELARHTPSLINGNKGVFEELILLRRALGFEGIAGHFALLTTRELSAGQGVEVAGARATVAEVTEAYFTAVAPAETPFPVGPPGSRVRVTLVRDQEARYETRCALLALQPGQDTQRLVFAHDEHPTRIQLRKAVRVTVRGPVHVNPVSGAGGRAGGGANPAADTATLDPDLRVEASPDGGAPGEEALGEGALLDISVGGAAVDASIHVPVGSLVRLTFQLDGTAYHDLLAFVLECRAGARQRHHMRLEFRNLAQTDERQLAASVAHYSAHPFTEPT
ncbi:MAG: PilZ domain-containing protein [Pseudomonadota bacterium]